jgi:hypothetical protein
MATDVHLPFGEITLAATLHMPDGPGRHPATVMIAGSGPDDRDSGDFFPPIREVILDAGVAVLSWDKPGVGGSTGDWMAQTFVDRADEAMAALSWLRAHAEIDERRVGAWGHSQGGWVTQMVAAQDPELAFAVINSGPGVDVLAQDLHGVENVLRARGATDADVARAVEYMHAIHAAAQAGSSHEAFVADVMDPARGTAGFEYFGEIGAGLWGFLVRNLREPFDPVEALEQITCPVLALFGERDVLVPVEESVRVFRAALARANNADVTIHVFPGADHVISTGDPPVLADGYAQLLGAWLRRVVG